MPSLGGWAGLGVDAARVSKQVIIHVDGNVQRAGVVGRSLAGCTKAAAAASVAEMETLPKTAESIRTVCPPSTVEVLGSIGFADSKVDSVKQLLIVLSRELHQKLVMHRRFTIDRLLMIVLFPFAGCRVRFIQSLASNSCSRAVCLRFD